jgi:DNA polymerase III subunit delta'
MSGGGPGPSLWEVPGQHAAVEVLRNACARAEVSHAWAFIGPGGVGQEQAAHALTAALNCVTPRGPGEPCGECSICDRALRGAYAAYEEFVPSGGVHRVDDVRDAWLRAASVTLLEGTWKVLRVVDADRMNDAAANAFLKGLEEPPERTVWLLDIADPEELPDTILSRCRALRFAPLGTEELDEHAQRLGMADPADRGLAVRLANGVPGVLRRLARKGEPSGMDDLRMHRAIPRRLREEGPGFALVAAHAIEDEVKRTVAVLAEEGKTAIAALAVRYGDELPAQVEKQMKDRIERQGREAGLAVAQAALDDLLAWYRDVLLVDAGGDPAAALHCDAAEELRADAEALGSARALEAIDLVLRTRDGLERNVGRRIAFEALFMELSTLTLAPVGR